MLELKRSSVSVGEGIRQNISNQEETFIRDFFTTMQFCFAGNDTEGLRYGTIGTPDSLNDIFERFCSEHISDLEKMSRQLSDPAIIIEREMSAFEISD